MKTMLEVILLVAVLTLIGIEVRVAREPTPRVECPEGYHCIAMTGPKSRGVPVP